MEKNGNRTWGLLAAGFVILLGALSLFSCGGGGGGGGVFLPSGTAFVYVANSGSNDVSMFRINGSGRLVSLDTPTVATEASPRGVVVEPSGRFAYVPNANSGSVSQYAVQNDGSLVSLPSPTIAAGLQPWSLTMDPNGRYLYVANFGDRSISAYTIDSTTGQLAEIGSPVLAGSTGGLCSVVIDPSGRFVYAVHQNEQKVYEFSVNDNGSLSSVSSLATGTGPYAITIEPAGTFAYVANSGSENISAYSINATTGALTALNSPGPALVGGIGSAYVAVDPASKYVYATRPNTYAIWQYSINIDGTLNSLTPASLGTSVKPFPIAADSTGKFVYVSSVDTSSKVLIYSIKAATGELTAIDPPATAGTGPSYVYVTKVIR